MEVDGRSQLSTGAGCLLMMQRMRCLQLLKAFLHEYVSGAVVYDMNGREAEEADIVLGALGDVGQYIFCSSAGVYLKSHQMPHYEVDAVDPKSRHKVRLLPRRPLGLAYE